LWNGPGARPIGTKWGELGFVGLVLMTTLAAGSADATVTLSPATAGPFAVGLKPTGVATGDFNGGGMQDIAVSNSGAQNVTVLPGNGAGGFTAAPGSSPFS